MFGFFLKLVFLVVLGPPVEVIQGVWELKEWKVREPGEDTWGGAVYGGKTWPTWNVQGKWIEEVNSGRAVTKRIMADPNAWPVGGPAGVRFVDYDGSVFTGSYEMKDGKLVLTLFGRGPVKGKVNTEGTKYLTIHLERPKPRKPDFAPLIRPATDMSRRSP